MVNHRTRISSLKHEWELRKWPQRCMHLFLKKVAVRGMRQIDRNVKVKDEFQCFKLGEIIINYDEKKQENAKCWRYREEWVVYRAEFWDDRDRGGRVNLRRKDSCYRGEEWVGGWRKVYRCVAKKWRNLRSGGVIIISANHCQLLIFLVSPVGILGLHFPVFLEWSWDLLWSFKCEQNLLGWNY